MFLTSSCSRFNLRFKPIMFLPGMVAALNAMKGSSPSMSPSFASEFSKSFSSSALF